MSTLAAHLTPERTLPASGTLVGRVWNAIAGGPSLVRVDGGDVIDITASFATLRDLCEQSDPAAAARGAKGQSLGALAAILANTAPETRDASKPWLLAPIDLQAIKAAGVTFAISMLERVIEERARGNPQAAADIRASIRELIGEDLSKLKPGSPQAMELKRVLIAKNMWSQYLEVGIGPDAEIFTKSQVMAAVGHGQEAGLNPVSSWNNPEPEVVVVVASTGRIVGASLGNDVNLRDVEGRSGLLLGKAKDNNASCAIGPFVRLFDEGFGLDQVRSMQLTLTVEGEDGYVLKGSSNMAKISRDPADLVGQMLNAHHQYPDGAVLFLGTLFAPVEDRDVKGQGFTHKMGDIVTVASPELGALSNRMVATDVAPPWTFGASHLMRNLARRGLLEDNR
ncbi:MAG: fumarylacetoacetate hydrolase family protein [Rhizobiales bacterium]|nr:fumarylacetoacetate hydrolase family protein [Hyphomicrobiales bacterium]MBI3673869.1 fumarylacetoacetate hydrolase family protein [Hyphomicrobiales bacterium]